MLYESLHVFVKHVGRYSMDGRPAGIDCKPLVSMMDMMQGRDGGSKRLTFLINEWDSLARLIYVRFYNKTYQEPSSSSSEESS